MGSALPSIPFPAFRDRFHRGLEDWRSPGSETSPPDEDQAQILWLHYEEMRRWNPRLSLVGPGTADEVVERHYAESWAGSALLSPADRHLVDVGTGGGFPGVVLSVARPELRVTLVEPRSRKVAFLLSALRAMTRKSERLTSRCAALRYEVLDARVDGSLPPGLDPTPIDVVTSRALSWSPAIRDPFLQAPSKSDAPQTDPSGVRFLLWRGEGNPETDADDPPGRGLRSGRELRHANASVGRRIVELLPT